MAKKMIALDMDGTLFTSTGLITVENKNAIREAQKAGHIVIACSGRPHDVLLAFLEKERLGDLPVSASNGSITVVDGEIIDRVSMDMKSAAILFDWLDRHKYPFKLYTNKGVFQPHEFLTRAEFELTTNELVEHPHFANFGILKEHTSKFGAIGVNSFAEIPNEIEIYKIYIMTPNMEKKALLEQFAHGVGDLVITSSFADNVELSDLNGHKGNGITVVANHFNIPIEDTIAIGDNLNDAGMMEVAGLAIAMGNADQEIIAMADIVTLTNDEDGVAHAIRKYVL